MKYQSIKIITLLLYYWELLLSLPIPTRLFPQRRPSIPAQQCNYKTDRTELRMKQTKSVNHNPSESHRELSVNTEQPLAAECQWRQKRAEYSASQDHWQP